MISNLLDIDLIHGDIHGWLCKNLYKYFLEWKFCISMQISLKIFSKSVLVQVMVWRPKNTKPLPELMMTPFTDACMYH